MFFTKFYFVVVSFMILTATLRQRGLVAAFSTSTSIETVRGIRRKALSSGPQQQVPAWREQSVSTTSALWMSSSTSTPPKSTTTCTGIIPRVKAADATAPTDGPVLVKGWVRTVRKQKTLAFVEVNDGSNMGGIQCVLSFDGIDEETKKGG